jgi:purine-binding chemotaxis protein CheW
MSRRGRIRRTEAVLPQEAETARFVTFRAGAEEYGVEINAVAEVIRPLRITPLPRMPEFVEGVINLRGVIIPVVDLRKRFRLPAGDAARRTERMMIAKGALPEALAGPSSGMLALVVDDVHEVVAIPKDRIEAAPQAALSEQAEFIAGMAKDGDRLIVLLDIPKLLTREERAELAEAGHGDD